MWTNVLISPRAGEAPEEVSDLLTVEEEMTATEMLRRLDFEEKHLCHLHEDLTSALTPERSRRSIATPDSPSSVLSHTPVVHRQLFPSQFSTPVRQERILQVDELDSALPSLDFSTRSPTSSPLVRSSVDAGFPSASGVPSSDESDSSDEDDDCSPTSDLSPSLSLSARARPLPYRTVQRQRQRAMRWVIEQWSSQTLLRRAQRLLCSRAQSRISRKLCAYALHRWRVLVSEAVIKRRRVARLCAKRQRALLLGAYHEWCWRLGDREVAKEGNGGRALLGVAGAPAETTEKTVEPEVRTTVEELVEALELLASEEVQEAGQGTHGWFKGSAKRLVPVLESVVEHETEDETVSDADVATDGFDDSGSSEEKERCPATEVRDTQRRRRRQLGEACLSNCAGESQQRRVDIPPLDLRAVVQVASTCDTDAAPGGQEDASPPPFRREKREIESKGSADKVLAFKARWSHSPVALSGTSWCASRALRTHVGCMYASVGDTSVLHASGR